MKKITCLLLVLVCAFSCFACMKAPNTYKQFVEAAKNTSPTNVTLTVKQVQAEATLNAKFITTYAADGSATIEYTRDEYNEIGSGDSDELISPVSGTVTCDKDGNYSDGGAFAGNSPIVSGVAFNFDARKMTGSISADGKVLSAVIKSENTKAVLGVEIAADVTLAVTKNEGKIISFTVEYTAAEGHVSINCFYN